ncbi:MAG: hypothetical protein U0I51_09550 [Muricomes sp.]|nr:hypothetical protein [Muricomes sp.]
MSKRFRTGLSGSGFRRIAREIHQYRNELTDKCEEFAYRLAEEGVAIAQIHIGSSGYGKHITLDSEMKIEGIGCRAIIFMEDAQKIISQWQTQDGIKSAEVSPTLMLEFGAGLKAENPTGIPGVGTGTFPGGTHGNEPGWYYMDINGEWHHCSGISANLPMYKTGQELRDKVIDIAKDVFGL